MVAIADFDTYTRGMKRSMEDKLFFLSYLDDIGSFVDFGCADGTLLNYVHEFNPDLELHGIDASQQMLNRCVHLVPEAQTHISTMPAIKGLNYTDSALNLSSVLHELYSYSDQDNIDLFWQCINDNGYQYVFIRDMCCDAFYESDPAHYKAIVSSKKYEKQLEEFQERWGTIKVERNLIHFLLKYRYQTNWQRELDEHYLPVTDAGLDRLLCQNGKYRLVYKERYTLPWLKENVKKDFGITLTTPTHMKMIYALKQ